MMRDDMVALHLVEEINHRVVNEYSEAIASLNLAAARAGDHRIKSELMRVAERLHRHAEAHRALMPLRISGGENLADYLDRICGSFTQATLAERGVTLTLDAADIFLSTERCWRMGLVVAELIRNAARHGRFETDGQISVQLTEMAGQAVCRVENGGTTGARAAAGRGQEVIRFLMADLGGVAEWTFTENECVATVYAPTRTSSGIAHGHDRATDSVVQ